MSAEKTPDALVQDRVIGLERISANRLKPHPKNWRTHPAPQRSAIRDVLERIGFAGAVTVRREGDDYILIDGHLRAEEMDDAEIPVLVLDVTAEEAEDLLLAYDPIAAMAEANQDRLVELLRTSQHKSKVLLESLQKQAGKKWVEFMASTRISGDPDAVPDPPKVPITKPGDLWLLGDHRLLCGDATSPEDVGRLMNGAKAEAVITDPPYGIDREGVTNDDPAGLDTLLRASLAVVPATDAVVIAFASPRLFTTWLDAVRDAGQQFERALWFYDETDVTFPWRGWLMTSQIALVSSIGTPRWNDKGPYHHDCYIVKTAGRQNDSGGHPTAKPFDVVSDLVAHTHGDVYDPFLGSGTTLIAAEQLERRCYGLEIEPAYCDVIVERFESLTGKKANRV